MQAKPVKETERLANPVSNQERGNNGSMVRLLHPANRLRLMLGQPFLEDDPGLKAFLESRKKNEN